VIETVLKVLGTVLRTEVNAETSVLNTPQWDSLRHIEVIFAIEDATGVQFDEAELAEIDSVSRLVSAIEAKQHAP
jgi:acyl carrier protein